MREWHIRLDELSDEGQDFDFPEQEFWEERFAAHDIQARVGQPIAASAHVSRQEESALIQGALKGSVLLPCDRCAEEYELALDISFDEYESVDATEAGEEPRIENDRGALTLDIGAVLWEQFVLALPPKPVCADACKGVCSGCGANLNENECSCEQEKGDPRLAVFRDLKLK